MTPPTFEYCAFRFLNQWQEDEAELHRTVSGSPTPADIRTSLSYFQVARSFEGIAEDAPATFVAESLIQVREDQSLAAGHAKVHRLAGMFKDRFKRFNLSAASKLLWLSHREQYVIYDSRAIAALTKLSDHPFADRDYGAYAEVWREHYKNVEPDITKAVSILPSARPFMRCDLPPDQKLLSTVHEAWFKERVFDIYLWVHNGEFS